MKKNLTEMVFILDKSGSMAGLEADTIGGFNSMIQRQKQAEGEALVSTVLFSNSSTVIHDRIDLRKMRIMPAVLYCIDRKLPANQAIDIIHKVGGLTHAHIRSNIACGLYYFMASSILNGDGTLTERLQSGLNMGFAFYERYLADHENIDYYDRLRNLSSFIALPEDSIHSSGYVVDAFEAAVWALINSASFEETLLKAVNLGDDTDTVGAIAGGLAELLYGYDAIPGDWLEAIQRREWIESLCENK